MLKLVVDNKSSSESRTRRLRAARSKSRCHLEGTRPRSRHLRLASDSTPIDSASRSIAGHRSSEKISMPDYMDKSSTLSSTTSRAVRARLFKGAVQHSGMTSDARKAEDQAYKAAFRERVQAARIDAGYTQIEMAKALGLDKESYAKYENRSALPHQFLVPFAAITKVDIGYLLTGEMEAKQQVRRGPRKPQKKRAAS